jgi:cell division protein FtsB
VVLIRERAGVYLQYSDYRAHLAGHQHGNRQLEKQQAENQQTKTRNALLDAEVRDLKQGIEAIEERARSELGMIKQAEIFFQILES